MRKNKRRDDDDTEVDMTPMLDIVFIMLIFFIVTTSFVKESGIDINRPKPDKSEQESNIRPILIAIDENSEITMGSQIVDVDAIIARVQVARAQRPKGPRRQPRVRQPARLPHPDYPRKSGRAEFRIP